MKTSHTVKGESRVIRVAPQAHHRLKVLAAEEGVTLSDLATEALEAELARRQASTTPDRQP
jgi:predicted HicB family RNase H-like nuclease